MDPCPERTPESQLAAGRSQISVALRAAPGVRLRARRADGKDIHVLNVAEVKPAGVTMLLALTLRDGEGELPPALSGRTLRLLSPGFAPLTIPSWNGEPLDLVFQREKPR